MANKKEEIGELAIALSFESKDADKQISALNRSINRTEKEFKSASKGIKDFENTYQGLNAKIKKTSKQLDDYNKKLEVQEKEQKTVSKALETNKKKLDELENSIGKNSEEWKEQAKLVQKNADKLAKLSSDISITKNNISKLTSELNDSKSKFEDLGNKSKTLEEKLSAISKDAELTKSEFNKLGVELNQSGTFFQKLGNEINKLSSEIKSGESKIQAYETEINKLSDTLDKQKNEYSSLESKIKVYSSEIDRLTNIYGENSSITEQYRQELYKLKDSYNTLGQEINQNENELKQYKTELNNTQIEVKELSNELLKIPFDKIGENIQSAGNNLKTVGQSMSTSITLPSIAVGAAATKIGIDFDRAMSKVQAISGATAEDFKKLKTKSEEMGKSTKFSASESAEAMTYMGMAGWKTNDMLVGLEGILNLAAAGGTDLALASDIVTDGLTGLGLTANDSSKFVDIMAATITSANTNVEMMGETLKYAGPVAGALGIKMEDLSLAIGLMGNAGIKSSQSGTALRAGLTNLVKPTKQMKIAMEKYGINIKKTSDGSVDLMATIKHLREKMGGLNETTQANALATIFGKEAMSGWAAIINASETDFNKLSEAIANSDGKATELAQVMQQNLGGSIDTMKSALEGALKDGFEAMLPVIDSVVGKITDLANWFSGLDEEQQKNIVTMVGVAATLGPLLSLFGQFLVVGGNAVTLFGALKTGTLGATASTGLLSSAIAILTGPAGLVLLVSSIIAVASALGDNEKKLTELQEKWGLFGQVIGSVCETMTGTVELSIGNISIMISTLGKIIGAVFRGDFKSIDDIWTEGWTKIENKTAIAMSNLRIESSSGIALMRQMSEVELNNLVGTLDIALKKLPTLTADNVGEMAEIFVTRMQGLDADTLTILRGTSDTMAVLFEGIRENMDNEQATNKFKANLESMAKSGEFTSDKINKDISYAMELIDKNVMDGSERVKISAQNMFDGIASISQFGMDSAVNNIVYSVNSMSDKTIQCLSDMGGHWHTIFGGIALTGKDAVGDMESHVKGRLEELSKTSPNFIYEMKEQMNIYFEQINESGSINTNELSSNVETELKKLEQSMSTHSKDGATGVDINTKSAVQKADTNTKELVQKVDANTRDANIKAKFNMDNAAKDIATATSNMAKEAKKGTGDISKNIDLDMQKANKAIQQSATDMYNGSKISYSKMADVAKTESLRMSDDVTTNAEKMRDNAKQAATDMYKGVTTSTKKMADKAIADWDRIRDEYSKSIEGTVTKTTFNKTITQNDDAPRNINSDGPRHIKSQKIRLLDSKIIKSYGLKKTKTLGYAISSNYYNFNNTKTLSKSSIENSTLNTINHNKITNDLLNQIIEVLQKGNTRNGLSQTMHVHLNVDGKEFTDVFLPYLPEKLKQNDILNNRRRGDL